MPDSTEIETSDNPEDDIALTPSGEEIVPAAADDSDDPEEDDDDDDEEDDDLLDDVHGTDDLIGKLRETDKTARAMRAAMEAEGWTFDAEGNPAPPVPKTPAAAPAPDPNAPPQAPAPDAPAPRTEWKGYAVAPDGLRLHDPAYEDADSEEYDDLVYGTIDAEGNVVTEGIGQEEYLRRLANYQRAQNDFGAHVDTENQAAVQQGYAAFAAEFNDTNEKLKTWLAPAGAEAAEQVIKDFTPRATGIIEQLRADLTGELVAAGIPQARALAHVNAQLIKTPGLYQRALAQSIVESEDNFKEFVTRIAGKGSAASSPATPLPTPRPPVPPIARGTGAPAGDTPREKPAITPTAEEIKFANDLGVDPVKFATKRRSAAYNA